MSKHLAVAVVAFACVSLALGAAVKIRMFHDIVNPGQADGMAILNYKQAQDNTVAQIILSDLEPSTAYVVTLREPDTWRLDSGVAVLDDTDVFEGEFFFPLSAGEDGQLSTDSKGHLTVHATLASAPTLNHNGDWDDSDVLIFLFSDWDAAFPPDPERFEFPNLRIPVRLIGCNPNSMACP